MVHAKFAGEETIVMVPFFAEQENPKLDVVAGDIGYYPGRQTICLFYGETKPFGEVSYFARVGRTSTGSPAAGAGSRGRAAARAAGGRLMATQTAAELVEELRRVHGRALGRRATGRQRLRELLPAADGQPARASSTATSTSSGRASSSRSAGRRRSTATCELPELAGSRRCCSSGSPPARRSGRWPRPWRSCSRPPTSPRVATRHRAGVRRS